MMTPQLCRAGLLSLVVIAAAYTIALFPVFQQLTGENLTVEQVSAGRWVEFGNKEPGSEIQAPIIPQGQSARASTPPRQLDRTIQRLREIVFESPMSVSARSNLAYAFLVRSQYSNRSVDLVEALEQLELALDIAPHQPEVLYNRALVLTRLGLRFSARWAWTSYLIREPESPWSGEARHWVEELRQPTLFERWESRDRAELLNAAERGDERACASLVATYPTFARLWIEENVLPDWAGNTDDGTPEAASRLNALRLLGQVLARVIHDSTVAETIAKIDDTAGNDRELLLGGLRLYGRGMAVYRAYGVEQEKNELLERAAHTLKQAGSPLSRWARFYRAVGWHRTSPEIAFEQLSRLAAETETQPVLRQPALAARIEWMLGTNEETRNHYEQALGHYRRSHELLSSSEGVSAAAFINLLNAEVLGKLGETGQGWASRIVAIQELAPTGNRQFLHAALYSTVEQLLLERRFSAAQPWIREMEGNAARWGAAPGLAEAALQRGHLLAEKGRVSAAEESFKTARLAASRIGDSGLRRRTSSAIDLYHAESLLDDAPEVAEYYLARARAEMLKIGYRFQLPRLDWARARASLAMGDRESAMAALRSSIAEEEVIRREVRNEAMRASAFEGAQRAFDTLVELEINSSDGDARAFGYAEQSRARVLLDLVSDNDLRRSGFLNPVTLDRVVTELPMRTNLLEFAVLPDRLVVWSVRNGESHRIETKISASSLERQVDLLRNAISRNASEVVVHARASELWSRLLGPIARDLRAEDHLVIVPDRFLGRVPFAVLFDPTRRRYLLQDHRITVAPSASAFLAEQSRRQHFGDSPPSSVLAVGANHPGETWLPTVEGEAISIGNLYPRQEVLTGKAATRGAFLAASRMAEVLHFAGHGKEDLVASRRSRILFQPAGPKDSGLLFSEEIAAEHLTQTRLAVLAACRSVSTDSRGRETLSGIAAAFLAAGVPTIVASLWDAEDRATGELMLSFHRNLRRGVESGEALRRAQLHMLRPESRFRSPRYWAGFVVVGAE